LESGFDQEIGRLDVAVEHAVLMGVVEGFGGLDAELGDGAEVFAAIECWERGETGDRLGVDRGGVEWWSSFRKSSSGVVE
jgi:hypothetical protein